MAWRAKCYECGQNVPITRPLYEKQSLFVDGDLGLAIATYEAHPRRPTDTRRRAASLTASNTRYARNDFDARVGHSGS